MPAVWNGIYVLALIGIYMILLSAVAQIHLKCDKKKYYKNYNYGYGYGEKNKTGNGKEK